MSPFKSHCETCGNEVDSDAAACPSCGAAFLTEEDVARQRRRLRGPRFVKGADAPHEDALLNACRDELIAAHRATLEGRDLAALLVEPSAWRRFASVGDVPFRVFGNAFCYIAGRRAVVDLLGACGARWLEQEMSKDPPVGTMWCATLTIDGFAMTDIAGTAALAGTTPNTGGGEA